MPDTDEVLMMRLSSCSPALDFSRQYAAAQRLGAKVPFRWTAITASHSSSVMLTRTRSRRMPALLTTTWRSPKVSTAWRTIASAPLKLATLSPLATASPPMPSISSTTCCAGEVSAPVPSTLPPRSLTTTLAPCRANDRACSRPIPRPAPVTMATRPSHSFDIPVNSSVPGAPAALLRPWEATADSRQPPNAAGIGVSAAGGPRTKHSDAGKHSDGRAPVASGAVFNADVVIVGGGPAGVAAAVPLARAGRDVVVLDKAVFPRDKCCGDGLTTLALRELEGLGLHPKMVPNWKTVDAAWLRSPSGREVCLPLPADGIFAATTPRRELDAALVDIAEEAGATVLQGRSFDGIRSGSASVEVDVADHGTIETRYVIAADGMWSPTRKALGVGEAGYLGE